MSVTFILILLLVIGVVVANIALLRLDRRPMPVKANQPVSAADETSTAGKTQAAITSAVPLTSLPNSPSTPDSTDNGSAGD